MFHFILDAPGTLSFVKLIATASASQEGGNRINSPRRPQNHIDNVDSFSIKHY